MKIEDVETGKQYITSHGMVGTAKSIRRDTFFDGRYQVKLVSNELSQWVYVTDIEPVDESPKEEPLPRRLEQVIQMSTDENHDPLLSDILNAYKMDIADIEARRACTGPLSLSDTPVSQMTFRQSLVIAIAAQWVSNPSLIPSDCTDAIGIADEVIAEMERTKK